MLKNPKQYFDQLDEELFDVATDGQNDPEIRTKAMNEQEVKKKEILKSV